MFYYFQPFYLVLRYKHFLLYLFTTFHFPPQTALDETKIYLHAMLRQDSRKKLEQFFVIKKEILLSEVLKQPILRVHKIYSLTLSSV